jgi:predicted SprT family Zn-dependent metalloprotease
MSMSHDDSARQGHSGFRAVGVGMVPTFRCGDCDKPKISTGRKMKKVKGLRTWVCKACVEKT